MKFLYRERNIKDFCSVDSSSSSESSSLQPIATNVYDFNAILPTSVWQGNFHTLRTVTFTVCRGVTTTFNVYIIHCNTSTNQTIEHILPVHNIH